MRAAHFFIQFPVIKINFSYYYGTYMYALHVPFANRDRKVPVNKTIERQ
jgi:hypothetical protein